MEQVLQAIISKLGPEYILLGLVLYGGWKFILKLLDHGKELTAGINSISTDLKGIRSDLSSVVGKLGEHEERIEKLEGKS